LNPRPQVHVEVGGDGEQHVIDSRIDLPLRTAVRDLGPQLQPPHGRLGDAVPHSVPIGVGDGEDRGVDVRCQPGDFCRCVDALGQWPDLVDELCECVGHEIEVSDQPLLLAMETPPVAVVLEAQESAQRFWGQVFGMAKDRTVSLEHRLAISDHLHHVVVFAGFEEPAEVSGRVGLHRTGSPEGSRA